MAMASAFIFSADAPHGTPDRARELCARLAALEDVLGVVVLEVRLLREAITCAPAVLDAPLVLRDVPSVGGNPKLATGAYKRAEYHRSKVGSNGADNGDRAPPAAAAVPANYAPVAANEVGQHPRDPAWLPVEVASGAPTSRTTRAVTPAVANDTRVVAESAHAALDVPTQSELGPIAPGIAERAAAFGPVNNSRVRVEKIAPDVSIVAARVASWENRESLQNAGVRVAVGEAVGERAHVVASGAHNMNPSMQVPTPPSVRDVPQVAPSTSAEWQLPHARVADHVTALPAPAIASAAPIRTSGEPTTSSPVGGGVTYPQPLTTSRDMVDILPPGIDPVAFAELPADIRAEILATPADSALVTFTEQGVRRTFDSRKKPVSAAAKRMALYMDADAAASAAHDGNGAPPSPLTCPLGTDPDVFATLPRYIQLDIVRGHGAFEHLATGAASGVERAATDAGGSPLASPDTPRPQLEAHRDKGATEVFSMASSSRQILPPAALPAMSPSPNVVSAASPVLAAAASFAAGALESGSKGKMPAATEGSAARVGRVRIPAAFCSPGDNARTPSPHRRAAEHVTASELASRSRERADCSAVHPPDESSAASSTMRCCVCLEDALPAPIKFKANEQGTGAHRDACVNCAQAYALERVGAAERDVRCMCGCGGVLAYICVRRLLGDNEAAKARLDSLLSEVVVMSANARAAAEDLRVVFCTNPLCASAQPTPPDSVAMVCRMCQHRTCTRHGRPALKNVCCAGHYEDEEERARATRELLALVTKDCPSCHVPIEKNGGCRHMTCAHCKHEFFWCCLRAYRDPEQNRAHNRQCND